MKIYYWIAQDHLITEFIDNKDVCRTAPATQGQVKCVGKLQSLNRKPVKCILGEIEKKFRDRRIKKKSPQKNSMMNNPKDMFETSSHSMPYSMYIEL